MDNLTGHIILSEMTLELGVFQGELPLMKYGIVQLPWNPPVGNPDSCHRYLLRGLDYNQVACYLCDCGQAFIGFAEAHDHFFNNFRSSATDPFPVVDIPDHDETSQNEADNQLINMEQTSGSAGSSCMQTEQSIDEGMESTDARSSHDDFMDQDKDSSHSEWDMSSDESDVGLDDIGNQSTKLHNAVRSKAQGKNDAVKRDAVLESESNESELSGEDPSSEEEESSSDDLTENSKNAQIQKRLIAEALFLQYGYPKEYKFIKLCAVELNIEIVTMRKYIRESKKQDEKQRLVGLTDDVKKRARKLHKKIVAYLANRKLPEQLTARSDKEKIMWILCSKKIDISFAYREILRKKWKMCMRKMQELYLFTKHFHHFYKPNISSCLQKKCKKLDACIISELRNVGNSTSQPMPGKGRRVLEERLIMEAIWEKYGLNTGIEYRNECTNILKTKPSAVNQWYSMASIHYQTFEKSYYNKEITNGIRAKAEEVHTSVLKTLKKNPDFTRPEFPECDSRKRLIVEGLFKNESINLTPDYRKLCASILGISKRVMYTYWREAKTRIENSLENPLEKLLDETILSESSKLHKSVTKKLQNAKKSMQKQK